MCPRCILNEPTSVISGSAKRLTISELARSLGVSASTVSNAINGRRNLSAETRQRVLGAISELGYTPSHLATALRTGKTSTLGLILPNITNPLLPLMAQEIERAASARGQAVMLMDSQDDLMVQAQALDNLNSRSVDAVILVACRGTGAAHLPDDVILIDAPSNPRSNVSSDHFLGGQLAARHLLDLGHTRVSVLAGPENSGVARERHEGARSVLHGAGLDFVRTLHSSYGLEHGEHYARTLYRAGECSAVYAVSDSLAVGLIRGFSQTGVRVPQDVSVMGFDDVIWGELITPALSTVRQNTAAIAQAAVRMALGEKDLHRAVPVELVPRGSTGPCHDFRHPPTDSPAASPPPRGALPARGLRRTGKRNS